MARGTGDPPEALVLYVGRQGSRVRVSQGRVIVQSTDDAELLSVPQSHVSRVVCVGSVGVSAGARSWALLQEVPVVFLSRRGSFQGLLVGSGHRKRLARLRLQLDLAAERRLLLARRVLEGKLLKQAVLLRHFTRDDNAELVSPLVREIETLIAMLPSAAGTEELMGLEGAAARSYFRAWQGILPNELAFTGRNRQPPLDVVNAALGYGYAILLGEATSALVAAGLEPSLGCLHSEAKDQPALALDLMEEFRPVIVDQVVVQLCRSRALRPEHGAQVPGKTGVLLTKAGKSVLLDAYERRMTTTVKAHPDFAGTWRRHLYRQAQHLVRAFGGEEDAYRGLSWR